MSRSALVAALVLAPTALALPAGGAAAVTITVTSTADAALVSGCDDGVDGASTTLREALCAATAAGAPSSTVVQLPAGTVHLNAGELAVRPTGPTTIVLAGAGAAATTIDAHGASRVLDLDPDVLGGLDVTVSGLTLTGGVGMRPDGGVGEPSAGGVAGGGAVLAGSGYAGVPDGLTLTSCVLDGNRNAPVGTADATASGGAVQMTGGHLTVTGCTFTGNRADEAPGGAIAFFAVAPADTVAVSGSTFTGNTVVAGTGAGVVGGAGIFVDGGITATIGTSTFTGNTVTSASSSGAFGSAAFAADGAVVAVTGSQVRDNVVTGAAGSGGALHLPGGSVVGSLLSGNTTTAGGSTQPVAVSGPAAHVDDNWWGCADPATSSGCDVAPGAPAGQADVRLALSAAPAIAATGDSSALTLTATMSDGSAVPSDLATLLTQLPLTWATTTGTVSGPSSLAGNLTASGTLSMGASDATVTATLDTAAATTTVAHAVPPQVVTPPAGTSVAAGTSATFTVAVSGSPTPSVRWQTSAPGSTDWADLPGATGTTLTVTAAAADDGRRYRAVASNGSGADATSAPATLTVTWGPQVTTQPSSTTVVAGAAATFTVAAAGSPAPSVQWQTRTSAGTWTDVPGATDATYTRTSAAADDGLEVRAVLTGAGTATSSTATLTVQHMATLTGPVDTTVDTGAVATFTVDAGSSSPAPTVTWQQRAAGGSTWTPVAGATGTSLQVTGTPALDGTAYRAVATFALVTGDVTTPTAAATLTVRYGPVVDSSPADVTGLAGGSVTFTAAAHGTPTPTVVWQTSPDGSSWTPVAGATGGTYTRTLTAGDGGLQVRAVFSGAGTAATAAAHVTLQRLPSIVTAPTGVTVDSGSPVALTVVVDGAPAPTVQWQRLAAGSWTDVAGATATTLTIGAAGPADAGDYRVVATSAVGTVTSAPATVQVLTAPTVTTPADEATAPGTAVTFRTTATGTPTPTLVWQTSTDGTVWSAAGTGAALVLTPSLADDGLKVRVVATSTLLSGPASVTSPAATLTVVDLPKLVQAPAPQEAAVAGQPLQLSWVVESSGGTATWWVSRDGGTTWVAPPPELTTTSITGVAQVTTLRGAPAPERTAWIATLTPTPADDGMLVGLQVTNAAGTSTFAPAQVHVAAAAATQSPASSAPATAGTATPSPAPAAGSRGALASTGAQVGAGVLLTVVVLGAGAGLVLLARRRRA